MAITEEQLNRLVAHNRAVPVRFAQQVFIADGRGVLYCPARDALVVSDLHFEKGSYMSRFANPLPQLDSLATLQRLQEILSDYAPAQVICLGDSFHDAGGFDRMGIAERKLLAGLTAQYKDWVWIAGNHDPEIPAGAGGRTMDVLHWGNIRLQHEPDESADTPSGAQSPAAQIIGHFHPKTRTCVGRKRFSGKCFVSDDDLFIMPAFGQYTGGLDVSSGVLTALLKRGDRQCFLLYENKIYRCKPD